MNAQDYRQLWDLGYSSIKDLEVESGILASGKDELYGCIFGRDSLITALLLLRAYKKTGDIYFLDLTKKILLNLVILQGKEVNIESGEEPGKIIHEFRPDKHEHLTSHPERPWYLYPDQTMKIYDSVDSTPLFLLAAHEYMRTSGTEFLPVIEKLLPHVKSALDWILAFGDSNDDGLIDYRFHEKRTFGGLEVQSWMDSHDSAFHEGGEAIAYPIAPIEVQGYTWSALKLWADYFRASDPSYAEILDERAKRLKEVFDEKFVRRNGNAISIAFAISGDGEQMNSPRSSAGHLLWAAYSKDGDTYESILDKDLVPLLVERLMQDDLFVPAAGIRTLSSASKKYQAQSYHNGAIWPHDTEIVAIGLENFGYENEAARVREALFSAYSHFRTPLEFFGFENDIYTDRLLPSGQRACQTQAWSAAALLSSLSARPVSGEDTRKIISQDAYVVAGGV